MVRKVFIRGEEAWTGEDFAPAFERKKLGRVLRAREVGAAPPLAMAAE